MSPANVSRYYADKGEGIEIEIIAFNAGLHMLRSDSSPVKDRIASFRKTMTNVSFKACRNTMTAMARNEGQQIDAAAGHRRRRRRRDAADRTVGEGLDDRAAVDVDVAEAIARDDRKAEGSGFMSGGGCRCLVAALASHCRWQRRPSLRATVRSASICRRNA